MKMQNIVIIFLSCVFLQTFTVDRGIGQAFSSKVTIKNDSKEEVEVNPVFAGTTRGWTTILGKNDHKYYINKKEKRKILQLKNIPKNRIYSKIKRAKFSKMVKRS